MKGLILSGGKGTRLRPMTHTSAKQLLPVGNQPIIKYGIDALRDIGIKEIGVVVSPETGKEVESYLKTLPGVFKIIKQEQPLGLAHAIKVSKEFLQDSSFIMYLGDNILQQSLKWTFNLDSKTNICARVLLKEVEDPSSFGVALLRYGKIIKLVEKPKSLISNLALVGVYMFTPAIHEAIDLITPSPRGELEITDAIQKLVDLGRSVDYRILEGWWLDTGKRNDLLEANRLVLDEFCTRSFNKKLVSITHDTSIEGRVEIGASCEIYSSIIRGPVRIGKNCKITNSYISPFTTIGDNSVIFGSSLENSIIRDGCNLEYDLPIKDSLIGSSTFIGRKSLGSSISLMLSDDSQIEF